MDTSSQTIANELDMELHSQWWRYPNMAPPSIANNTKDLIYEVEDSQSSKRGGRIIISRDVYVLYHDYSQTVVNAQFEQHDPENTVSFEQQHSPPPVLRQDQLEDIYEQFGRKVLEKALSLQQNTYGPEEYVREVIKSIPNALPSIGNKSHGALVYANLANATVRQFDEIRPGDVMTFKNAKFQGHKGNLHQKYTSEAGTTGNIHLGIVSEWDGSKRKVKVLEQNETKAGKVRLESYRLSDLKSGEVKAFRVVSRSFVGWD
jgi:hypothetical protein